MNKIKAYLLLLTIALSAFAAACSSDDNDPVTPEITISENILANGMSFSKAGGTNTLSVKSNVTLEVTSNQDWCVVTPAVSASATVFKYTIDVKSNSTTDNRTSVITVKGGNLTETFNVIQTATEGLDLETVLFEDISAAGGTITVKVMTNGEPTITINDSWITEKTETRAMVDKTKTFIIAANTGKERTGTITFILGDLPATTVTVKQLAGGEISSNEIAGEDPWTVAKVWDWVGIWVISWMRIIVVWPMKRPGGIKRRHRLYLINWLLRVLLPYVFLLHGWDILETPPVMK